MKGRNENGTFRPGCPPGPGRPSMATDREYLYALRKGCSPADLEQVVRRLVELAKGGDVRAARILLDRCLGRPPETVHVVDDNQVDGVVAAREAQSELVRLAETLRQRAAQSVSGNGKSQVPGLRNKKEGGQL